MRIRTRIAAIARQRGRTAAEIARETGLYRSNLSAMDAGRRSASLQLLGRVARVLDCGVGDLLEGPFEAEAPLFRRASLNRRLLEREQATFFGQEKGWVNAVVLAWQRHHRSLQRLR